MKGLFPQLLGMFLTATSQLFVLLWNYFSWGELSHPVLFHFPREFTANGSSLQGYKALSLALTCVNSEGILQLWNSLGLSWGHFLDCIMAQLLKSRVILCNSCFSFYYNLNIFIFVPSSLQYDQCFYHSSYKMKVLVPLYFPSPLLLCFHLPNCGVRSFKKYIVKVGNIGILL